MRLLLPVILVATVILAAPARAGTPARSVDEILAEPPGFKDFVRKAAFAGTSRVEKTQALVRLAFESPESGGLGITYANDQTRTVAEVWRDRKANCISLTAFYVAACRELGLPVAFADAPSVSLWVRRGPLILNERHLVAVVRISPLANLIVDFSGQPHGGDTPVEFISEDRFQSLFHSNRASELLLAGDPAQGLAEATRAVAADPGSGIAWNTLGAVQACMGDGHSAESSYRKALEVDPKNGPACGNLERLLEDQGRGEEAKAFAELGQSIRDRDPYYHAFLAKDALVAGHVDEALAQIRRAIRILKGEPEFYLLLAQAELDRGERRAAVKAVEKAIHWSLPAQRKRMESKLALLQGQQT